MPIDFQPVSEGDSSTTTIDFRPEEWLRVTIDFQPIDERPITPGALSVEQPTDLLPRDLARSDTGEMILPPDARPRTPGALATQMPKQQFEQIYNRADPFAGQNVPIVPQEAGTDEPIISEETLFKAIKALPAIDNEYTLGAKRSVAKMASGMTTAKGIMATALAPFMPALVGSYFAVEGAKSAGEIAGQTSADWKTLSKEQKGERVGDLILSGAIPASVIFHAASTVRKATVEANTPPTEEQVLTDSFQIAKELTSDPEKLQRLNEHYTRKLAAIRAKAAAGKAIDQAEVIAPATAEALRTTTQDLTRPPGATSAEPTKGVEPNATTQRPSGQITEWNIGEHPPGSESGKTPETVNSDSNAPSGQAEAVKNELIGMGGAITSEGSKPTITDLIPPRPGESPQSVPRPETPNKTLFQSLRENFGSAGEKIKGFIATAAGKTFPKTTALSREAGEMGARYISSSIAARPKAEIFSHDVLAGLDIDPVELGAALSEDNLRSVKVRYEAETNDPNLSEEARGAARDAANRVFSFVGEKGTFKTEQAYQDYLNRNEVQEAIQRHKDNWDNVIEPMFREAMRIDPDVELPARGLQTGARVNLAAIQEGETVPRGAVWSSGKGNLLNTLQRKSPFGVRATGAGQAYLPNYINLIENSFGKQLEIANKNTFDASLVKNGLAVIDKPGQHPTIGGESTTAFPIKRKTLITPEGNFSKNEMIYVRNSIAQEYRTAANVDNPWMTTQVFDAMNRAALAGLTDATVHLTNLSTSLAQLPASKLNLLVDSLLSNASRADLLVTAGRVIQKAAPSVLRSKLLKPILPERIVRSMEDAFWKNQSQLASLAEIGALKGHYPSTGPVGMRHMSELIQWYDRTVRAVLDDAYQDLAKRGIVENTETARREFVNQIGQYNLRAQGPIMQFARKSGIGPFATAGRAFNVMGVRGALLSPGVKATSAANALALRANAMSKWMGTLAFVGMANYLLTGKIGGRPGTGFGKIDTSKNDEQGRMKSFDVMGLTGQGRALRVTGARGAIDATMKGLAPKLAADASVRDLVNSWISPIAGPPVRAGMVAASGFPPAINVGRVSRVVPPSDSQAAENLKQALIDLNPVVSGISKAMEPGKDWQEAVKTQLPRFTLQAKQTERMMEQYPPIVRKAKARAFIDDVIHVARGIENPDDKIKYLRESLEKLDPADREHAMRTFKEAKIMAPR